MWAPTLRQAVIHVLMSWRSAIDAGIHNVRGGILCGVVLVTI